MVVEVKREVISFTVWHHWMSDVPVTLKNHKLAFLHHVKVVAILGMCLRE